LKPVSAPDAVDSPPVILEHRLAQPIAISCGSRGMIRGTIAFNAQDIAATLLCIDYSQIDEKSRDADLGVHFIKIGFERGFEGTANSFLKGGLFEQPRAL